MATLSGTVLLFLNDGRKSFHQNYKYLGLDFFFWSCFISLQALKKAKNRLGFFFFRL